MAGKGSKPRPVKKSIWDSNFDEIFKKGSKNKSDNKETNKDNFTRGAITQEIYENILRNS